MGAARSKHTYDFIFKIIRTAEGFKVNQESNGYWWHHDGVHATEADARAWVIARVGKNPRSLVFAAADYQPYCLR